MPNKCIHHATLRRVIKLLSREGSTSSVDECGSAPDPTFRLQIKPKLGLPELQDVHLVRQLISSTADNILAQLTVNQTTIRKP